MKRERLDLLLVKRGFYKSRENAKKHIIAGYVKVNGERVRKPSTLISINSNIEVIDNLCPYVSRGGLKLEDALNKFNISVDNYVAIDIGASTGGFTDCLLKKGAKKVYAVDVGYGQLDWKLRNDKRVIVLEKINARYLNFALIGELVDIITIDVSFISLKLIIPSAKLLLKENGSIVALIKPQFEAGRKWVSKGGIVKDPLVHKRVITEISNFCIENNLYIKGLSRSPIKGAKGNIEYFIFLKLQPPSINWIKFVENLTIN